MYLACYRQQSDHSRVGQGQRRLHDQTCGLSPSSALPRVLACFSSIPRLRPSSLTLFSFAAAVSFSTLAYSVSPRFVASFSCCFGHRDWAWAMVRLVTQINTLFKDILVAYGSTPSGLLLCEHADWIMAIMAILIGFGAFNLPSEGRSSKSKPKPRGSGCVRPYSSTSFGYIRGVSPFLN